MKKALKWEKWFSYPLLVNPCLDAITGGFTGDYNRTKITTDKRNKSGNNSYKRKWRRVKINYV
jgi:hypothetical protein